MTVSGGTGCTGSGPRGPRWPLIVLVVCAIQCLAWGGFILASPEQAALRYGLQEPPGDLFLWQGTGLVILLYGVGYLIAATDPMRHWAVVLIGLLAKLFGPIGICLAVCQHRVPERVLWLLPVNDVIWWIPLTVIVVRGIRWTGEKSSRIG